jgi:hypothetical protein
MNRVLATAALVLLVLLGLQTWRLQEAQVDLAQLEAAWAKERTAAAAQRAAKQDATRTVEQGLTQSAHKTRRTTNAQVRTLAAQRSRLLERLRLAEANATVAVPAGDVPGPADAPADRQAPAGSAGAGLPAPLGAEDVREAERADVIRLHLVACYRDYDRAAAALKALQEPR